MGNRTGHFDKSCLTSTVKNGSGVKRKFGFLPPHGRELAINAEFTVFGNILDVVGQGPDISSGQRNRAALSRAIDAGDIILLSTPAPILVDEHSGATKMITLNEASLGLEDPCWNTSDSLDVDTPP